MGCFVIGAAVRVWRDRLRLPSWAAPVALVVLLVASVLALRGHASTYLFWGPLIAALTGVLVLSWRHRRTVGPALRPLVLLGTVSYGAYLWNYPLTLWLRDVPFGPALAAGLTLLAASLSWMLLERPLQHRFRARTLVSA